MKRVLIASLLMTLQINAQTTIGWDTSCDYNMNVDANSLQQAIDDGMTELRLTNENTYMVNLNIDSSIIIKGGYNTCANASAGSQSETNSLLDGGNIAQSVMQIGFITNAMIEISHLTMQNGTGISSGNPLVYSGGLSIRDVDGIMNLNHLLIESNNSYIGGGLNAYNGSSDTPKLLTINATDVILNQNTATDNGGGLNCHQLDDSARIVLNLSQGSTIRNNHSDANGGGMINNRCEINFYAGTSLQTADNPDLELYKNTANKSGAGIWSQAGTTNFIGSVTQPLNITENEANLDTSNSSGAGGGVFMTSNRAIANLSNTYVTGNYTGRYGAGLFSNFDGVINMNLAIS
jgi:hypothetical protein